jgi:hypothetical protein
MAINLPIRVTGSELAKGDGDKASAETLAKLANKMLDAFQSLSRRSQTVELSVITKSSVDDTFPLAPIRLADGIPDVPGEVRVAYVENLTDPSEAWTSGAAVFWKPIGGRQMVVTYITGLSASRSYKVRLRIEP